MMSAAAKGWPSIESMCHIYSWLYMPCYKYNYNYSSINKGWQTFAKVGTSAFRQQYPAHYTCRIRRVFTQHSTKGSFNKILLPILSYSIVRLWLYCAISLPHRWNWCKLGVCGLVGSVRYSYEMRCTSTSCIMVILVQVLSQRTHFCYDTWKYRIPS